MNKEHQKYIYLTLLQESVLIINMMLLLFNDYIIIKMVCIVKLIMELVYFQEPWKALENL